MEKSGSGNGERRERTLSMPEEMSEVQEQKPGEAERKRSEPEKQREKEQVTADRRELRSLYAETIPYLLHWYDYNHRILPWREEPTPYHVWVSEIMLQQTRVEAVKGYYERFLEALPDLRALAEAEEAVLLKLWEGLGYYNRVRNMQKAARIVVEQYDGRMPADYDALRALPGIGDYTAGAVASIAFGLPYPAVDGNVLRVMSRIACNEADIAKEQTKQELKQDLMSVMPGRSGDFNQALMELGATVCNPNGKPLCEQCPVMHLCRAFHAGRETELPVKTGAKARRVEHRLVYIVQWGERFLLHKRENKGLLAGLWEFPNVLAEDVLEGGQNLPEALRKMLTELIPGTDALELMVTIKKIRKAKHIFSHVEWHMEGMWLTVTRPAAFEGKVREAVSSYGGVNEENGLWEAVSPYGGISAEKEYPEERKCTRGEVAGNSENGTTVLATWEELRERYSIPSAFGAFVKEIEKDDSSEEE